MCDVCCVPGVAGRGVLSGRGGVVVRAWDLASCTAIAQYTGHTRAVHTLLPLPTPGWAAGAGPGEARSGCLVASLDVTGGLHVWDAGTSRAVHTFIPEEPEEGAAPGDAGVAGGYPAQLPPTPEAAAASMAAALVPPGGTGAPGGLSGAAAAAVAGGGVGGYSGPGLISSGSSVGPGSSWEGGGNSFLARGAASGCGWYAVAGGGRPGGSGSPGGVVGGSAAGVSSALGLGGALGYTCLAAAGGGGPWGCRGGAGPPPLAAASLLLAGTADGRVVTLDMDTGGLVSEVSGAPGRLGAEPRSRVVTSLGWGVAGCHPWCAAGCGTGWVTLLDMRCGGVVAAWQAHEGAVTQVEGMELGGGAPLLLTCGSDRWLRVWDIRAASCASRAAAPGVDGAWGGPRCLAALRGSRDLEGFQVYQEAAVVYSASGGHLGIVPVAGPTAAAAAPGAGAPSASSSVSSISSLAGGSAAGGGHMVSSSSAVVGRSGAKIDAGEVVQVQMSPVRGLKGGGRDLGVAGMALLPASRLLLLAAEDGHVHVVC